MAVRNKNKKSCKINYISLATAIRLKIKAMLTVRIKQKRQLTIALRV